MMRIAELLATHIPNARLETIDGGSHFLPATNPGDLAELVITHVRMSVG
jgi:pimeloyl-ACP methyl ester carboxylesterase